MDQIRIQEAAIGLRDLLYKYAVVEKESDFLHSGLGKLISDALSKKIIEPLDTRDVPGGRMFDESDLRKHRDLEEAFVKFTIEITGGEDSLIRSVARQIEAQKLKSGT